MKDFIMLMGLPASGKTSFVEEITALKKDFIVLSSDAIRQEFQFQADETVKTFEILYKRMRQACEENHNVIYDATNLSRKNRMACLNYLSKFQENYHFILYNFILPVSVCKYRNKKRANPVPEYVYDHMLKQYNVPMYSEGWDIIRHIFWPTTFDFYDELTEKMSNFDQQNSHHSFYLLKHCTECANYVIDYCPLFTTDADVNILCKAALFHDIGKMYTQTFTDKKGNLSKDAHYYSHDNYGSYIFLSEIGPTLMNEGYGVDTIIKIAVLINWHMRPYFVWDKDPNKETKATQKDMKLLGSKMFHLVELLHECDRKAH